jgi:hypothetical protein
VGARDHDRVYARGVAGANGFGHGTPHDNGAKSTGWRTVRPTGWGEDAAPRPALGRPNGDFMATIRRAAPGCAGAVGQARAGGEPAWASGRQGRTSRAGPVAALAHAGGRAAVSSAHRRGR